ncbi:MAG TPA: hypothetical protein VKB57_08710 [Acidimicrobiales bacterium]|nr:hypothetical protein [Acidimicrobiales bacterium]
MNERGQVLPLAAAMLALVVAGLVALVPAARAMTDRARAATAADAAALAGATGGEAAARRLAAANGGRLEAFRAEGDQVIVRVRVGVVTAAARAGRRLSAAPCARARCRSGGSVP